MGDWVQECPACGYCAPDLAKLVAGADDVIRSADYQAARKPGTPRLVSKFQRWAMLAEAAGDTKALAEALRSCAWAADDAHDDKLAAKFRVLAAEKYESFLATQVPPAPALRNPESRRGIRLGGFVDPGAMEAVTADLWRRAKQWDRARLAAECGLAAGAAKVVKSVLEFEIYLVGQKDAGCYAVDDISNKYSGPET